MTNYISRDDTQHVSLARRAKEKDKTPHHGIEFATRTHDTRYSTRHIGDNMGTIILEVPSAICSAKEKMIRTVMGASRSVFAVNSIPKHAAYWTTRIKEFKLAKPCLK